MPQTPIGSHIQHLSEARLGLGIDAGGTFTDAVLLDTQTGRVMAKAKARTTPRNPAVGIGDALDRLPEDRLPRVDFVSLATTFATNAIVQGRGARAGLILIGYEVDHPSLSRMSPLLRIRGGHDYWGEEKTPLDCSALEARIDTFTNGLDAVAVSAYFSTRNPGHEIEAAEILRSACRLPVVCGHSLSTRLDAPKRAATAWWNARLIPLICRLIDATETILDAKGINAPLMVVKGDGTLTSAAEAGTRPVETLLSGPAASIMGARHLSGQADGLVVDMGGTTTDMARLRDGRVEIDPQGARVGRWQTQVDAARIRTTGLGGDSIVFTRDGGPGGIELGPDRVEPICALAEHHPEVVATLAALERTGRALQPRRVHPCTFYDFEPEALERLGTSQPALSGGPVNEHVLFSNIMPGLNRWDLQDLENEGLIRRFSLTPTDFCVADGVYAFGDRAAAQAAIRLFAQALSVTPEALARHVASAVSRHLCMEAARHLLAKDGEAVCDLGHLWLEPIDPPKEASGIQMRLSLACPVIGVGAPASAWLPRAFQAVSGDCRIVEDHEVATAVGAAAGTVALTLEGQIHPTAAGIFTLFTPAGKTDFDDLETAVAGGRRTLEDLARERMAASHISAPHFSFAVKRRSAPIPGGEIHVRTDLFLQANGRMDLSCSREAGSDLTFAPAQDYPRALQHSTVDKMGTGRTCR